LILHTPTEPRRAAHLARGFTTFLCCAWGYSFAYSFFRCVLDRCGLMVCLAAALPLVAVWASLERKRWGRLALIGLSLLAQALFGVILAILIFSHHVWIDPAERHFFGYVKYALRLFGETPETTLTLLLLSAATAIWLFMPWARAEYIQRKKRYLTPGQRVIAVSIVALWGLTMIATPTPPEIRFPDTPLKTPRRLSMRY
jgi:hypothetical protein